MAVYTVSQVTQYVKQLFAQDELLGDTWVSGEVSNLRISRAGHAYFTLKDSQSQLRCVMFDKATGMDSLADGAAITAHGYVSFYEARGSLDFITDIVMAEGVGPLALEYERLKARLQQEGLFDPSRKRKLPRFSKTIGVVTSATGAVLHDVLQVLNRRYPLVKVLLAPTLVQGPEAANGIRRALQALNDDGRSDLILLARGGGSLEELWPFNEEAVVRTIYASRIPVVSAVGHETDYTIADFVADVRAPTPSAAAEMIVPDRDSLRIELAGLVERLNWSVSSKNVVRWHSLAELVSRLHHTAPDVDTLRRRVDDLSQRADVATLNQITFHQQKIGSVWMELQALNPSATLQRGYAVVQKESSRDVVSQRAQVKNNDRLKVTVTDGAFFVAVRNDFQKKQSKNKLANSTVRLFS